MRKIVVATMSAAVLLTLSACSSDTPAADQPTDATVVIAPTPELSPAEPDEDKYRQTWVTHYDQTSCTDFQRVMTAKEQWVSAADLLSAARTDDVPDEVLPADAMVDQFAGDLDAACTANPDLDLATIAAGVYTGDPGYQK